MFRIAFRNIMRNMRRSVLTGLSVAVAVMIVIYLWSFMTGIVENTFNNFIRLNSGHIRILNKEYVKREKMLPLESSIPDYAVVSDAAERHPEVVLSAGHIKFGVLLEHNGSSKPVMGLGVDPDKEDRINNLSAHIIEGQRIGIGREEINIGDKLARELGLKLGDTLTVVTQTAYGSISAMNLKIVGIYRFGVPSVDGKFFYMPLGKAQELLDLDGRVTEIFLLIKNMDNAPRVAKEIGDDLEKNVPGRFTLKPWQEQGIVFLWMRLAKYMYGAIYMVILFLASFTILNTMFMSVLERSREIGMMKSMGMKDRQIVKVILYEALLIGMLASFIGALCGAGIAYYLSVEGINFTATLGKVNFDFPVGYIYRAVFKWTIVLAGFAFGVLFSVLAAIPPARRAAKMQPAEALREI